MAFAFSKFTSKFKFGKNILSKKSDKNLIGVDIGSSSIKIVQLHMEKNMATLDTYGELQLGPYAGIEVGRTTNLDAGKLTEAFVDILREASAAGSQVSLAISFASSFTTIISVPTTDEEKIATMIPVAARKHVPVPLNEVVLDWFPVLQQADAKDTKVFLAAIYFEALKKYKSVVEHAKLETQYTEIEMFSSARSSVSEEDETVALIDMGAGSTKLYIATKGVVGITHSVRMGGSDITDSMATDGKIEFGVAEDLKRQIGLLTDPSTETVRKGMYSVLDRGFRELHQVITRYSQDKKTPVQKIILCGSGSLLRGIDVYATDRLQTRAVFADPFSKVSYPAFLEDTLREAGPAFSVAVGAALRIISSER